MKPPKPLVAIILISILGITGLAKANNRINQSATLNTVNTESPTHNDLLNSNFLGMESSWQLNFYVDYIEFKMPNQEVVRMLYTRNGLALNYELHQSTVYSPNNELIVTAITDNQPVIITIWREGCSVGVSDGFSPFSIHINGCGNLNNLYGCGQIKEEHSLLVTNKNMYETQLNEMILNLRDDSPDAFFYHNNIREYSLYKESEVFKRFVNQLFEMGYGIEQAEGHYYLYIGEPMNYRDGEMEHDMN